MLTRRELYRCAGCLREVEVIVGVEPYPDTHLVVYHRTGWCGSCANAIRPLVQLTDDDTDPVVEGLHREARAIRSERKALRRDRLDIELRRRVMFARYEPGAARTLERLLAAPPDPDKKWLQARFEELGFDGEVAEKAGRHWFHHLRMKGSKKTSEQAEAPSRRRIAVELAISGRPAIAPELAAERNELIARERDCTQRDEAVQAREKELDRQVGELNLIGPVFPGLRRRGVLVPPPSSVLDFLLRPTRLESAECIEPFYLPVSRPMKNQRLGRMLQDAATRPERRPGQPQSRRDPVAAMQPPGPRQLPNAVIGLAAGPRSQHSPK